MIWPRRKIKVDNISSLPVMMPQAVNGKVCKSGHKVPLKGKLIYVKEQICKNCFFINIKLTVIKEIKIFDRNC